MTAERRKVKCPVKGCDRILDPRGLYRHIKAKHPEHIKDWDELHDKAMSIDPQLKNKDTEEEKTDNEDIEKDEIKVKQIEEVEVEDLSGEEEGEGEGKGKEEGEKEEEGEGEGEDFDVDLDYTKKDVEDLCEALINLPAIAFGDHLIRTEAQIKPFAKQLYIYCKRKGIDPRDYIFDEIPLIISAGVLARGMWNDHLKHKEELKKEKIQGNGEEDEKK